MSAIEIARISRRIDALEAMKATPEVDTVTIEARIQAALAEVKASVDSIKEELKEYIKTMLPTVPRRVEPVVDADAVIDA